MEESMLTTVDNPHNPFDEFDAWYAFDFRKGYHSPSLLARVLVTSDELSDEDQSRDMEDAIDVIVSENVSGVHTKVTRVKSET
jgi:hypothetical protein